MSKFTRRYVAQGIGLTLAGGTLLKAAPARAATEEEAALGKKLLATVPPHGERALGRADAPVVVVEYASATCPHCAEFHVDVLPSLKQTYIDTGKVRWIFREFPLDQRALAVFMLTRCIPEEKYFGTIDMVFRRQELWNGDKVRTELLKIMQMAGLSEAEFDACLKRQDLATGIYETGKAAKDQFGVKGTPTFFVNGKFVDGHKDSSAISAAIDAALAGQ
ncbi:MAG: DsbA family protein [Alphaproteobacteria bacterium]|nr:DsbA family protein [Alphaproteobacteria bacterium]